MTPFLALPTELATATVTHLDPFLLATVALAYNPAASPNQSRPFASLLRLLVRDNGAASFLRHVQLVCPDTAEVVVAGPSSFDRNGWWDENRLLFEGVLEDLQMSDRDRWRHALRDGDTRALIALVLAYCVELESLEAASNILFFRDGAGDNWLLRMFRHLLGVRSQSKASFEKLRRITISAEHWNDENNPISPEDISWWHRPEIKAEVMQDRSSSSKEWARNTPQWKQAGDGENLDLALLLFCLPALEELSLPLPFSKKEADAQYATGVGFGVDDEFWPLTAPPWASRLRTLRIRLQYAPEAALETILATTPSLRTLRIELSKASTTTPINCSAIQRALRHVETTLEDLKLTAGLFGDEACDVQNLGKVVGGRIGGGDEVKGIKSAEDPYHDMMLVAAAELAGLLPRGLEVLTINDDLWFYDALPAWSGGTTGAVAAPACTPAWRSMQGLLQDVLGGPQRRGCGLSTCRFETKIPGVGPTSPAPRKLLTSNGVAHAKGSNVALSALGLQARFDVACQSDIPSLIDHKTASYAYHRQGCESPTILGGSISMASFHRTIIYDAQIGFSTA
ncbi:uncharacterized protein PG986_001719 [Apiospora aurea]|uniref:Uncharacterized protein n=1 Tax=Apiospora aurea TaxID=335848 RepID=A0ABR1QY96_9PEZI